MSTTAPDDDLGLAAEWAAVLHTAVLGTDRHPLAAPQPGWGTWCAAADPAVQLLDRAAAVTVARRAGVRPAVGVATTAVALAPADRRRPCPAPCASRLGQFLGGEHEVLLPEWFAEIERHELQLPWEMLPLLLVRGRRRAELDRTVRHLAGGRAAWLAASVPELGIEVTPRHGLVGPRLEPPQRPADSRAAIAAVLDGLADGTATWAAGPQLLAVVACVDPALLETFAVALRRVECTPLCDRTRTELAWLAETRLEMLREFAAVDVGVPTLAVTASAPEPGGSR